MWRGDTLVADIEELKIWTRPKSEINARRLIATEVLSFIRLDFDGTAKLSGGDKSPIIHGGYYM